MKLFWVKPTNSAKDLVDKYGGTIFNYLHNTETQLIVDELLPEEYINSFNTSDVLVITGTWGGNKRKSFIKPDLTVSTIRNNYLTLSSYADYFNTYFVEQAKLQNKKIIVVESSTISRCLANNYPKHSHKSYVRLSRDHWTWGKGNFIKNSHPKAPHTIQDLMGEQEFNVSFPNHEWKNNPKGYILLVGGLEWDPTSTLDVEDFLEQSVKNIRSITNRKIVIRLHPGSKLKIDHLLEYGNITKATNVPIQAHYKDTFAAVLDNSTSCFELLEAGIPVFCSKDSFAEGLQNLDVSNIETPYYASKEEVLDWANKIFLTEFKRDGGDKSFYFNKLLDI